EPRTDSIAREVGLHAVDRRFEAPNLRDIPGRLEHGHVWGLRAGAERLQSALIRLVSRVTGDRELLEPAARHGARRVCPEQCERNPADDDQPPATNDQARERRHHRFTSIRIEFEDARRWVTVASVTSPVESPVPGPWSATTLCG